MSRRTLRTTAGGAGAAALAVVLTGGPAVADVPVVDLEAVVVHLDATGKPQSARLVSQLTATGKGRILVEDPMSVKGLRSLDGFTAPTVTEDKAQYTLNVDGRVTRRMVADYDKNLPLDVSVTYTLDGQPIEPAKLAGAHGRLKVTYTVSNVSAQPTDITYKDGRGNPVTESVDVVTPFVGQLSTTLPAAYTEVDAPGADLSANGEGGTRARWAMILFEPLGQQVQEFGWSANVDGGDFPAAELEAAPVKPAARPELAPGTATISATAQTATRLTGAVTTIDENLGKLQDGAGELLSGLNELAAGASQLRSGLESEAAPGARQIADGLGEAHGGADRLAEAFHSSSGKADLESGSKSLSSGLTKLSAGLDRLSGASGLGGAYAGALALRAGVDQIVAGLGSASSADSVLGGLAQLSAGNEQLADGVGDLQAGAAALVDATSGLPAAKGGTDQVKAGLDAALATGGSIDQLKAGVAGAKATAGCSADPTCVGTLNAVAAGIEGGATSLRTRTTAASAGLGQVSAGLGTAIAGIGTGSSPGATTLRGGLATVAGGLASSGDGLDQVTDGVQQVKAGLRSGSAASPGIAEGLTELADGLTAAVSGVGQLASGAQDAKSGSRKLATGIAAAGDGVDQLAAGLGRLQTGAGQLDDGLVDAASGAGQIADGADRAAAGARDIRDGTGLIRRLGTSSLMDAADDSARKAGKAYATVEALNTRAEQDAMPYGAPEGAAGTAAYRYELAAETKASERNTLRGLAALALFGLAVVAAPALRRFVK